jgi:hypothetical protein
MLATMSANAEPAPSAAKGLAAFIRSDYALIIGLGTAAVFLALEKGAVENVEHPLVLRESLFGCLWACFGRRSRSCAMPTVSP